MSDGVDARLKSGAAGKATNRRYAFLVTGLVGLAGTLSACSGDTTPPADILSSVIEPTPTFVAEPEPPANYPLVAPVNEAPMTVAAGQVAMAPAMAESTLQPEEPRYAYLPRISDPLARPGWAGGMPASERSCRQQLERLGVTYEDIPSISNGRSCGIEHPIKVTRLSGGIEIKPAAKLNCQVTVAFAQWVKNELAPAARTRYLSGVRSIKQLSSYSCRTMNSVRGAPMSEHASGNAIDVGAITLENGHTIEVRKPGFFAFREKSLLNTVRADSCNYFTTVLGPGYNRAHADHFHFDLRQRKSGHRSCR